MSLEDLKKIIYRPSLGKKLTERLDYQFKPTEPKGVAPRKPFLTPQRKKWLKLSLVLLSSLLIIIFSIVWFSTKTSFDPNKIAVKIDGLQKIESGELLKYDFLIKNDNRLALEETKLTIEYPEGSWLQNPERKEDKEIIHLGRLRGKEEKNISSYVKIFGPEDSKKIIRFSLSYFPSRLNTKLEKTEAFAVDIISSPLKIVIDAPEIIALNKNIVYTVNFSNQSGETFSDLRLRLDYPEGFSPVEFLPRTPDISNHTWYFKKIMPQEEQEFKITGKLTQFLDVINLVASLELKTPDNKYQVYSQAYSAESLTPPPISLDIQPTNLIVPGVVNPGQGLGLIINFQNTTDSVLRDTVLTLELSGEIFNRDSVMPSHQGIYLKEESKVIWDSRRIPQLAILGPFEAGTASVGVGIKGELPLKDYNDKNFTFEAIAKIRPKMVPPELAGIELENSAQTSVIKLNSVLKLAGAILPQTTTYPLSPSGPFPPILSQKTTYLITWQLLNYYNDLKNITVESYLPSAIEWENEWWPQNSNITFDPLTGKMLWQINELKAGTGFTSPVKQIIFKVSAIPSPSQVGERLLLLGESSAQAQDTFTNQNLKSAIGQLETNQKVER